MEYERRELQYEGEDVKEGYEERNRKNQAIEELLGRPFPQFGIRHRVKPKLVPCYGTGTHHYHHQQDGNDDRHMEEVQR